LECLHAAGETISVASEYPLMYCNAYKDLESNTSALGICLPATCSDDRTAVISTFVYPMLCTRSRHLKQWYQRFGALFDFISNKFLMATVFCSTVYHAVRGTKTKSLALQLFLAFSIIRNFQTITRPAKKHQKLITCIFGLRVIATLWVIVGHSTIFLQDFLVNVDEYRDSLKRNFFGQLVTNCFLSVEMFFLLSGILTSYGWFRTEPVTIRHWLQFYWHRVVRIWPAYAYVMFVVVLRYSVMHYHPVWQLDDQGAKCASNWWKNLLFINSITDNNCMPWSWYIGTEFIFHLLSPVYLLSFNKSCALGMTLSILTIFSSTILYVIKMCQYNFAPAQMLWVMPEIFNLDFMEQHRVLYIKPQYRISSYIIGLALGYFLATINQKSLSRSAIFCGWLLSALLGFSSLFGLYPALQGWHWWSYHLCYAALHRIAWAIAIAWLIFVCHHGHAYYLNKILSFHLFVPLSASCYSVSLHIFKSTGKITTEIIEKI
uniref:Acyl_transf_3 domain-containing protein n=1 Tax=Gongylonema pulchrum TaxID=637853 RepID=A0A183CUH7_9BILA